MTSKVRVTDSWSSRCGFTLLELVMVMAIVAILSAIIAPRYAEAIRHYRVGAAAQRLVTDLEYARARAKSTSSSRTVIVSVVLDQYSISGETGLDGVGAFLVDVAADPYRSRILSADLGGDGQLVFDGFGRPDADGVIIVRAGDLSQAINIDRATDTIVVADITNELVTELSVKGLNVVFE